MIYALRSESNLIYALRNFSLMLLFGMTWNDILELGPTAISDLIDCPVSTASSWIHRGGPATWLKEMILRDIDRPNKTLMATEGAAESQGKKKRTRAPSVP